mgnify:CR=1 FL=1
MKHKTIVAIAIIMTFAWSNIFAQTEKGNFILGGNTSFSVTHNNTETFGEKAKMTNIMLQPYAGYFIFNKFSAGLSIDYDYSSTIKSADVSVLTDFRYYFTNSSVKPFVKLNAGYSNQLLDVGHNPVSFRTNAHGLKLGAGAGVAIFFKDNMSIDITGQYFYSNIKRVAGGTDGGFYDTSRRLKAKVDELRLFIGFSVYL